MSDPGDAVQRFPHHDQESLGKVMFVHAKFQHIEWFLLDKCVYQFRKITHISIFKIKPFLGHSGTKYSLNSIHPGLTIDKLLK